MFSEADLIHTYTREEAIEDGMLVDLSKIAPEITSEHWNCPVACTSSVWSIVDKAVKNKRWMNDLNGVLHDLFWMCKRSGATSEDGSTKYFRVIIKGAGRQSLYTFKAVTGPDDHGTLCLTFMLPEED